MADDAGGDAYVEIQVDRETLVLAAVGVLVLLALAFLVGRWTAPGRSADEDGRSAQDLAAEHAGDPAPNEDQGAAVEEEVDGTPQFGSVPVGQPAPATAVPARVPRPTPPATDQAREVSLPPARTSAAPATTTTLPVRTPTTDQAAKTAKAPARTPTTKAKAATPTASATGSHVVQVGALDSKDQSEVLVRKLQAAGHAVRVVEEQGLFKVQVGPFATRAEADASERRLKRDGYSTWIRGS